MSRLLASAIVALAALTVGCGGAVGDLLATVPPPVEFSGGTSGLAELPKSGVYRGNLVTERVTMVADAHGAWTQTAVAPIAAPEQALAEIQDAAIKLTCEGETTVLFSGVLKVVPAKPGQAAATYADLTGSDGHKERYNYLLLASDPRTLKIVARMAIYRSGRTYRFDRYSFELNPLDGRLDR